MIPYFLGGEIEFFWSNFYFIFRWDNKAKFGRLSPWDLEPIDEGRKPPTVGAGVPVLPEEIVRTLYRPGPEDWGGLDRDSECDRISAELSKVMKLEKAKHFASAVDLNFFPSYTSIVAYPMDLSIIKSRLDSRFYHRAESVEFDVNYIFTNARKFYNANSPVIRSASTVTKLCLEIIRNREVSEIPTNYQQLITNPHRGPHSPASSVHPPDVPSAASSPNDSPIGSGSPSTGSQERRIGPHPYPLKKRNGKLIYKCNFCTKTCKQLGHLKDHLRTHTGERPFKCNVCTMSFTQAAHLQMHLKLHKGEKPHQCDICKRRFTQLGNLKLHKLQHTNNRIYTCGGGCQKKFVSANRLHTHRKRSKCEPNSLVGRSPTDSNGSSNVVNVMKKRTGEQPGIGGMAVPSKTAKATSLDYFPTSIAKRTRAQSTSSAGQRSAQTDASSKDQADEAPYSPDVRAKEEEEPIPGMNTQLRFGRSLIIP